MDFDHDYANYVNEKDVEKIQALEKEIGMTILAFPERPKAANLSEEDLKKIKALEKKLCVRLVAYDTH
jgi:hypothetical protein